MRMGRFIFYICVYLIFNSIFAQEYSIENTKLKNINTKENQNFDFQKPSNDIYQDGETGQIESWLDDTTQDSYVDAQYVEEDDSIRKWAWNLPNYAELYPRLKGIPWLEANGVGEITAVGYHKREIDESDTYGMATYASFRPFALDFGTYSFAFGVSFVGRAQRVEDITKKINAEAFDGALGVDVVADGGQNHVNQIFVNFSVLGSFPEIGLQIILDLGFGRSHIRQLINEINAEVEVDIIGTVFDARYDEYQYKQIDEMIFGGINILKSFDRPYLNFFKLFIFGAYRIHTKTRDSSAVLTDQSLGFDIPFGKQDLGFVDDTGLFFFPDPAIPDEFNVSFFGVDFIARLFTIYTPFVKDRGISINAVGAITHVSGQLLVEDFHGLQSKIGGQVGIFDAIDLRAVAVFEQGNQQENAYEFTMVVQLSAILRQIFKN